MILKDWILNELPKIAAPATNMVWIKVRDHKSGVKMINQKTETLFLGKGLSLKNIDQKFWVYEVDLTSVHCSWGPITSTIYVEVFTYS